eukprot:Skav236641  [mRNA]  locus=scaffold2983:10031:14697:- [translate_table: standard]
MKPEADPQEGLFKRGARHGSGTYYCADGGFYEGEFCEGMMQGDGTPLGCRGFYYAKKESYTGQWLNSMRHGYGKFTYHDGAVYEGRWEADLRHGQAGHLGYMLSCMPKAYNGNWADDMRHAATNVPSQWSTYAEGQMGFGDGAQYSGGWLNDARHGYGSYRRSAWNYLTPWEADIPEGAGKLHDADEQSDYVGQFHKGLRSGEGKCVYQRTGDSFSGEWRDGVRVQGLMHLASGDIERVGYLNAPGLHTRELLRIL